MRNGKDAVCFTAGMEGAAFSAGVIHAYLAADREPPKVVAGISMGALSAAAMQKAYRDFLSRKNEGMDTEAARWAWYRRYLSELSDRPLDMLWEGIPDPSDFFAGMPPVRNPAVPDTMREDQERARRSRFLLLRLGRWLAGLRVTVKQVFDLAVQYVRWKEGYPEPGVLPGFAPGTRRFLGFLRSALAAAARLIVAVAFSGFFPEQLFDKGQGRRPLFGRSLFLASWLVLLSLPLLALAAVGLFPGRTFWGIGLIVDVAIVIAIARPYFKKEWTHRVLLDIGIGRSLVSDFHLRWKLMRLFDVKEDDPIGDVPMSALIVAAPLHTLTRKTGASAGQPLVAYQVWAGSKVPLIEALGAALALPGILQPFPAPAANEDSARGWLGPDVNGPDKGTIDLVDGSVIRQNPIPALFRYLKANPHLEKDLQGTGPEDASVHVVYSVPAKPVFHNPEGTFPETKANIVDVARLSSRLARRRDTQVEVAQTNFMSSLAALDGGAGPRRGNPEDQIWAVFADEIAPDEDLGFENPLNPLRSEVLKRAAGGCRATLERLYGKRILGLASAGEGAAGGVPCARLLTEVAAGRHSGGDVSFFPGVPEVCGACPKVLRPPESEKALPALDPIPTVDTALGLPPEIVANLRGGKPRIILVTSGGVFRGSFHIGMAGALWATDIRPDLIVGASVGTLMGAAIAKMFDSRDAETLEKLVTLFLRVDEKVALTKTLKTATREIGVRGRSVDLSPAELRRLIHEGSRADAGFAAVGAPPALIDAISNLLMIPHRETSRIAADFVAGHITKAVYRLMGQLKSETVRRLDVEDAIMGVTLLDKAFQGVLYGESMPPPLAYSRRQPFAGAGIGFYCTTTDLGSEAAVILGDDTPFPGRPWDFMECCLASSAFPAVFSPRRESDLFPGSGLFNRRYADGGMFDNLPFLPAIRILSTIQAENRAELFPTALAGLQSRWERPDLMLVGALDINPEEAPDRDGPFDSIPAIGKRAATLRNNVKIRAFEWASEAVHSQIGQIVNSGHFSGQGAAFLDSVVDAGVLPVFPMDNDHLNKTFAFCRSTGLREDTVRNSIANGCFQTLRALVDAKGLAQIALKGLREGNRVPTISWQSSESRDGNTCPFFVLATGHEGKVAKPFTCPFAAGNEGKPVFSKCCNDGDHQKARNDARGKSGNASLSKGS